MKLGKCGVRFAIVIPVFNEAETIRAVVSGVSVFGSVIVVDDGSTDNSGQLAHAVGALVVSHEKNRGYDQAIASGLARAVAEGFDFAITVDGDGQHESVCIENFRLELMDGGDLVVGIRDRHQRFSETVFAGLAKVLWGISDPLCGMKGYRLSRLKGIGNLSSYPSVGSELTIRAVRSCWNIRQVPVRTRDRSDNSRLGTNVYANWLIIRAMIMGVLWARAYTVKNEVGI